MTRTVLQISPVTRINWLRPAGTIGYPPQCSLLPTISDQCSMALPTSFLVFLGGSEDVVAALRLVGEILWSSKSSDEDGGPLGHLFFHFLLKRGWYYTYEEAQFNLDGELQQSSNENMHPLLTAPCALPCHHRFASFFDGDLSLECWRKYTWHYSLQCTLWVKINKTANENWDIFHTCLWFLGSLTNNVPMPIVHITYHDI